MDRHKPQRVCLFVHGSPMVRVVYRAGSTSIRFAEPRAMEDLYMFQLNVYKVGIGQNLMLINIIMFVNCENWSSWNLLLLFYIKFKYTLYLYNGISISISSLFKNRYYSLFILYFSLINLIYLLYLIPREVYQFYT